MPAGSIGAPLDVTAVDQDQTIDLLALYQYVIADTEGDLTNVVVSLTGGTVSYAPAMSVTNAGVITFRLNTAEIKSWGNPVLIQISLQDSVDS